MHMLESPGREKNALENIKFIIFGINWSFIQKKRIKIDIINSLI